MLHGYVRLLKTSQGCVSKSMTQRTFVTPAGVDPASEKIIEHSDEHGEDVSDRESIPSAIKPQMLTPLDRFTDGQSVYGFTTPKRKDALVRVATDASYFSKSHKKQGKSSVLQSDTPSSKAKSREKSKTPAAVRAINSISTELEDACELSVGKYVLRKRAEMNTRVVQEVINSRPDCVSDTESDDEHVSDEESNNCAGNGLEKKPLPLGAALDEYFYVHSSKSWGVTSDNTLSSLINPKMGRQELMQHLKDSASCHIQETLNLQKSYENVFPAWMFHMNFGFNILVFGLGSKRCILEKFRLQYLTKLVGSSHILVNGYFPSLTMKDILCTITDDLLNAKKTFRSISDQCEFIKEAFNMPGSCQLYIVIHNIDGPILRSQKAQIALATLASAMNIHVIASIDHINAPLIWDQSCLSAFNWIWNDCTTFDAYSEETSYENSLLVQQSGTLALSSLTHVLRSLTPNAKGIFNLLVHYQLENADESSYSGMSFTDLYNRCREQFLVNSDLTLRAQLTEFRDHKLIKSKKVDGVEFLVIPLNASTLKQYLEEK